MRPQRNSSAPVLLRATLALTLLLPPLWAQAQIDFGPLPPQIEEEIEESVQEQLNALLEESADQITEQNIQENIEQNVQETIESSVDEILEVAVEDDIAGAVEAEVEERVAASIEERVDTQVGETVETGLEQGVEAAVEERVEEQVAGSVETRVETAAESAVEQAVETGVAETVAATVEADIESTVALQVEDSVAESVEQGLESGVAEVVESAVEEDAEARLLAAMEDRLDTEIDQIVEDIESDLEVDEQRILKQQWLVMAEPVVFEELNDKGYLFDAITELPGLGLRLAEVAAPSTFDITEIRRGLIDVVGENRAEVDLNHIYTAGAPMPTGLDGVSPREALSFPLDLDELPLRVGMIDSAVDTAHPALVRSSISTRSFARPGVDTPSFHGTAIASIIAGNSDDYTGLAPRAQLYAAAVFELDPERGEIASTVGLIRALDWLLSSGVDVVNVSLAGPPNRLLESALERAAGQNVVVMAAAGNGGPMARPMYPAAYPSVVAVTAVDSAQQVFRLANRGDYLALSAPGVDLRHASADGGYAASSGTSFAVPFAVTAAARLRYLQPAEDTVALLLRSALDLGPPGRDEIYGFGLLSFGVSESAGS